MDLRVTPQAMLANVLAQLAQQTNSLGKLQEQATTGKKVLTPSDNPIDVGVILASRSNDRRLDTYLNTIQQSQSSLDISTSALTEAGNILGQARTVAVEASSSTVDQNQREVMAQQIDRLLERMLDVANTQHAGHFLFAGTASRTKPFEVAQTDSQGRPVSVAYQGASERNAVPIGRDATIATLYDGADVFQRRERSVTEFTGTTGAAAGSGADNATGQDTLQVRHTSTTFAAGSGVQAGVDSVTGDTILGPTGAHQLTVIDTSGTGAGGTISLDGGPPVAFTSAMTNLKITGLTGEVVFVDTTAITAGFNGTVAITADGSLSTDGGATSVAIDFSANQVVTDSATGKITNVNSANLRRTGAERLDYRGTYDVFQVLTALRDDLRNLQGLSDSDQITTISQRIGELDRTRTSVLDVVGEQAASSQHLERLESHVRDVQLSTKELLSNLEDVDITEVILRLQANQNALNLTLATAARLQEQSLLDFLR